MKTSLPRIWLLFVTSLTQALAAADAERDWSPPAEERQLPRKMRSAMPEPARITVGQTNSDILGADHRALQAAVDYVAGLGGGIVEIGPGEYLMRDSLHLRPQVVVRGSPGKTTLRKADAAESPLAIDGDFGEEQVTVTDPEGFDVGCGVAIWSQRVNGFHVAVARIIGRNGSTLALDHPLGADCMVSDGAGAATVFPVVSGYELEGVRIEHLIIEGIGAPKPEFIRSMIASTRAERPRPLTSVPAGATDARFFRVVSTQGHDCLRVTAD